MLKKIATFCLYIFSITFFIPAFIVYINIQNFITDQSNEENHIIDNLEFLENNNNKVVTNNVFEDYIVGVVGAEMPISFEEEALKAQAVAARTYAYKRVDDINAPVDYKSIGQAYNSIDEMKEKWGTNFEQYYNKVKNAVYDTKGVIMTYDNEPIEAVFHSTSAGVTEVCENIWGKNLPYIKSVDSKVDEQAPNFTYTTSIPNGQIIEKLSQEYNLEKDKIISSFEIGERSDAGYVLNVIVCGKKINAREIRTLFSLRSTNFTIEKTSTSIDFTTKGYGHGAGMSQYGANFMAQDGSDYIEILNHYYSGITIQKIY